MIDGSSVWSDLAEPIRRMTGPVRVYEGTNLALEFLGEPGDRVYLVRASSGSFALSPSLSAVIHLSLGFAAGAVQIGVVPPEGVLHASLPIPSLPPSVQHGRSLLQMFTLDPQGNRSAGSPSILEMLSNQPACHLAPIPRSNSPLPSQPPPSLAGHPETASSELVFPCRPGTVPGLDLAAEVASGLIPTTDQDPSVDR